MNHTLYELGKNPITPRMFKDSIYEDLKQIRDATSGESAILYEKAYAIAIVANDPYAFDTQLRASRVAFSVMNTYSPSFFDDTVELIARYLYQKLRVLHINFNSPDNSVSI